MNAKTNPKLFWKYVNSKTRTKPKIGSLYINGDKSIMAETEEDKANILARYFDKVFVREPDGEIPKQDYWNAFPLNDINISRNRIRKIIGKLERDKSPGPDEIHPKIIKEMSEVLFDPLMILFESSFHVGEILDVWREA